MASETNRYVFLNVVLDSAVNSSCAVSPMLCINSCQNSTRSELAIAMSGELSSKGGADSPNSTKEHCRQADERPAELHHSSASLFIHVACMVESVRPGSQRWLDCLSGRWGIPLRSNDLVLEPAFTGNQVKPDGLVIQRSLYCGTGWTLMGLQSERGKMNWTHEMENIPEKTTHKINSNTCSGTGLGPHVHSSAQLLNSQNKYSANHRGRYMDPFCLVWMIHAAGFLGID